MEPLRSLWTRALHPREGFAARALEAPPLGAAVKEMVLVRSPIAFVGLVLSYVGFTSFYARLVSPESELWTTILRAAPESVDPADLKAALARLPDLPSLHAVLPGLVVLAPLLILSLWLHDATLDHLGLWLLRGLKTRRGLRASLTADAEALKVGAVGAVLALAGDVPGTGLVLTLLLLPVAVYFWIIRGYALAAWHGCPPWKGIVATLLNVVLAVALVGFCLLACLFMVLMLAQ